MNKRQMQKEATRKLILKAAYQIYAQEGFGASTKTIAKEAQIAHGSIFVHFPTVDELKISLLEQFGRDINTRLHELAADGSCLEEVLNAHINVLSEHEEFYKRLITESSQLPEQVKYVYVSIQSTVSFHLSQVIEKYQTDGKIKKLPMYFIFNSWISLLHYYLSNQDLFAPEGSVLIRYQEELVHNFIKMLE
ncbi:TetR/AcrR family transcriptional regulator [Anaerocolumna sp. MB42-C2]|uniref:TetR/AcrR family transcriptional regulator n=1 Tax=Anaerocolumna sp. MB42-C2 TaxID=3070997 RepID=UPI0027E18A82|nr:TetR/AcrR family transcriptional regulator [Anaerocolumna sp. MB42-C2]WMJ87121.1 TetR/AcrR family transcriptional regulator [Anaerocolumna sp. MB42-C2]